VRAQPEPLLTTVGPGSLEEIRAGLTDPVQKRLPTWLLYDPLGSSLFEAISRLPEYGLTRADERILADHASEIVGAFARPLAVAELGSGSGRKTRPLLESLAATGGASYFPIDISPAALERCARELGGIPFIRIEPIEADYVQGLAEAVRLQSTDRMLVLFLGSTLGNLEPAEAPRFLREVRSQLKPGDGLLLGTDLVKPVDRLRQAYDDRLGVTAAFDLNVLARLNRELGAEFDLERFRHEARWNARERRIEMHLVALEGMHVPIRTLGMVLELRAGESLWTESSYKFGAGEVKELGARAGFASFRQWTDAEWPFAETLFLAI